MIWQKTKADGCTILKSGDFEIVQLYEPNPEGGWQLNRWDRFYATCRSMRAAKDLAEELNRTD